MCGLSIYWSYKDMLGDNVYIGYMYKVLRVTCFVGYIGYALGIGVDRCICIMYMVYKGYNFRDIQVAHYRY